MSDIFLSYRRTDQELARALVEALSARGVAIWWDAKIEGGEDWREAIVANLTEAHTLVILFSEACNASKQLKKELAIADTLDKEVVPVLIEDTKPKGHYLYELATRNWLQIFPDPASKIDSLADRLAKEIQNNRPQAAESFHAPRASADANIDAVSDEQVAASQPVAAPAVPAETVESVVEKAEAATQAKRNQRDFLPFKWYELLLVLIAGALSGTGGDSAQLRLADGFFMGALVAMVIAAVVFPFRYYFRRRRVRHALRSYLVSTGLLAAVLGVITALHPQFAQGSLAESLIVNIIVAAIFWLIVSAIAFAIYGALHFQRNVRSFRQNVETL